MEEKGYPKVSFIIPVLNEEKTIRKCLNSILNLDYPKEKIEILIARGPSTDNTNKILNRYTKRYRNIKLLDNPTGNTAIGRNICIEYATGDMLMNYSGHTIAEKNLLKELALRLKKLPKDIAGIGCSNLPPKKQSLIGKAAGIAFSSLMGGKNIFPQHASYNKERYVEHMSFTCYRREIFDKVGKFDPIFWCGQDAEFDIRVRKAGYKILYTPKTKVYHFKRESLRSLFRQMYRYGIARAKIIKKHPDTMKPSHFIGTAGVIGLILLIVLTALEILPLWFLFSIILVYVLLCLSSSVMITKDLKIVILSLVAYIAIHFGYGIGFLRGLISRRLPWQK
ncbi:MAG: glycosyltransferase [Thermoplasmata archaeon]|nr:glycosyltransferase [Thermoplasmata archaeon]